MSAAANSNSAAGATAQHKLLAPALPSSLDTRSESFARNRADMLEQLAEIESLLDEAGAGGGSAR